MSSAALEEPFSLASIEQAERDQERYEAGYNDGFHACELKYIRLREDEDPDELEAYERRRLLEAYRLVRDDQLKRRLASLEESDDPRARKP